MRKRVPPLRGLEGSEEDRFRAVEARMLRDYANHNDFEFREAVRIALSMLTEEHRRILEMKYYRDLTEQAMSTELGIALGTVKTRLLRAKGSLHRILHELGFTESHVKVQGGVGGDS
jgi:RNA polymerase sigma factor (sigma-70 family)